MPGSSAETTGSVKRCLAWPDEGRWQTINHALVIAPREKDGREASPTAGVIDSQSAKTSESGGPRGFDAGKKIMGRKRHIVTDTQGHFVGVVIHAVDIQDRDCAPLALSSIRSACPWLRHFADGGYAGPKLEQALAGQGDWTIEIVKRPNAPNGFVLIARRWVVERTFAWILVAHIRRLTRKLARPRSSSRTTSAWWSSFATESQ